MANISVKEAIEILKDKIRLVRVQPNGEYIFKCPFCGDSDNPYHGHLYVSPGGLINCYKCEMKGTVNRLLSILEGSKYKVQINYDGIVGRSEHDTQLTQIRTDKTNFERYIYNVSKKPSFVPYFDIVETVEQYPIYQYKHQYMCKRIIGEDKHLEPIWYQTNKTQHLCSYYSEYFTEVLLKMRAVYQDNPIIRDYILNRKTSILFLGYNKTLNIIKNDSEESKYFKCKKNVYYGDEVLRDFFMIINQNKYINGITDLYKQDHLEVYFCEGVFDAINLYLRNPKYITNVVPDIIIATGSKVSYPSALYYILDTFMKPVVAHNFLDPDIDFKKFISKFGRLRKVYKNCICYQNGEYDYGDVQKDRLMNIKICWR